MNTIYYIYKITNTINNKVYMGQSNCPRKRWNHHRCCASNVPEQSIQFAIRKYGVDNFVFEIVASCLTLDAANESECIIIAQHNSKDRDYGYNLAPGGKNHNNRKLKEPMSEDRRLFLADVLKKHRYNSTGIPLSDDHKKKISKIHKGKKHRLGHTLSEDSVSKREETKAAAYGDKRCCVDGCDRGGDYDGFKINGNRYCKLHIGRLKRHGSSDIQSKSERKKNIKSIFTEQQILEILSDSSSYSAIAKKFKTTQRVINRIYEKNGISRTVGRKTKGNVAFTADQISDIISDKRTHKEVAIDLGISVHTIENIFKEHAAQLALLIKPQNED